AGRGDRARIGRVVVAPRRVEGSRSERLGLYAICPRPRIQERRKLEHSHGTKPIGPRRRRRLAAKYRRRRTVVATLAILVIAVPVTIVAAVDNLSSNISSAPLRAGTGSGVPEKLTDETNVLILGSDTRDLDSGEDEDCAEGASPAEGDGSAAAADGGPGCGGAAGARSDPVFRARAVARPARGDPAQSPRGTAAAAPGCDDPGHGASSPSRGMINPARSAAPACSVSAVDEFTGV